jgi:polyisoprenoid-binding protein YceI
MNILMMLFTAVMICWSGNGDKDTWKLDGGHSSMRFSVKHMGIANFNGSFERFDLTMKTVGEDFSTMEVEFSADVASINTANKMRDEHLLSEDFFDTTKYPKLTFKSKSVKKKGKNTFLISGDFTMHGITKTVELNVVHNATVKIKDEGKEIPLAGLKVSGSVKRSDFGISPDFTDLADEVYLDADLEIFMEPK